MKYTTMSLPVFHQLLAFLTVAGSLASAIPLDSLQEKPIIIPQMTGVMARPNGVSTLRRVNADFAVVGRSGVPAMHAALLQSGKVIFLDKVETYTELKLEDGHYAFSSIYDPITHELTPLTVRSNAFCAAGAFLADGRLVTLGGNEDLQWLNPTVGDGLDAIRYFDLNVIQDGWQEPGNKLASKRWYATSQVLGDGTIFVAAGSLNAIDPTNKTNNNPTYEILDRKGISNGRNIKMQLLEDNQPYWMYPFLHLLHDGSLFVFVSKSSQIIDVSTNKVIKTMPNLPGMYRTYPNTGGSVMLPLTKQDNYKPSIMICGGGGWQGPDSPGEASCGRIQPMSDSPTWTISTMPEGRCMVEGVLLLDDTVLWLNGAQRGAEGFGIADKPAFEALIYDPEDGSWVEAGVSNIARLYHSVALLLLDGTVLVAGSNPNEMPVLDKDVRPTDQYRAFPTEFRVEQYTPPYLMDGRAGRRPTKVWIETEEFRAGATFKIRFESLEKVDKVKVLLYQGGFVTHALHMGQVMVELESEKWNAMGTDSKVYESMVHVPQIVMAPGPYVIYVVVDKIPAIGQFVSVMV